MVVDLQAINPLDVTSRTFQVIRHLVHHIEHGGNDDQEDGKQFKNDETIFSLLVPHNFKSMENHNTPPFST
jgi:hypothetical protein